MKNDHTEFDLFNKDRRAFVKKSSLLASVLLLSSAWTLNAAALSMKTNSMTVQQVIDLILKSIPGDPVKNTVDTIKFGDPNQVVTGIVTTMFATVPVIEETARIGANFIIAHEPTFYNHADETKWLLNDAVYLNKIELLKKHKIVVWRFHDYIHRHQPDGVLMGVLLAMNWEKYYHADHPYLINIEKETLDNIIVQLKKKLHIDHLKYIGDDKKECSKIALLPGAMGATKQISSLQNDKPDLLIVGELNEWETSEYIRDMQAINHKSALIVLGHIVSEEPGLEWLKIWFRENIPGIKVSHLSSHDAFKWA